MWASVARTSSQPPVPRLSPPDHSPVSAAPVSSEGRSSLTTPLFSPVRLFLPLCGGYGVDVEPDVIQRQRVVFLLQNRLRERPPQLLGQAREVRPHRHRRGELVRVLWLDGLLLKPAGDLIESRRTEALLG